MTKTKEISESNNGRRHQIWNSVIANMEKARRNFGDFCQIYPAGDGGKIVFLRAKRQRNVPGKLWGHPSEDQSMVDYVVITKYGPRRISFFDNETLIGGQKRNSLFYGQETPVGQNNLSLEQAWRNLFETQVINPERTDNILSIQYTEDPEGNSRQLQINFRRPVRLSWHAETSYGAVNENWQRIDKFTFDSSNLPSAFTTDSNGDQYSWVKHVTPIGLVSNRDVLSASKDSLVLVQGTPVRASTRHLDADQALVHQLRPLFQM